MKIMAHEFPASHWSKLAKRNGIKCSTYHRRVDVYGWSKQAAATTPPLTPQQAHARRGGVV